MDKWRYEFYTPSNIKQKEKLVHQFRTYYKEKEKQDIPDANKTMFEINSL